MEDAFLGTLAMSRRVPPLDISDLMQDPPAATPHTAALFRGQMLVHRVTTPEAAFRWILADAPDKWRPRSSLTSKKRGGSRRLGLPSGSRRAKGRDERRQAAELP